MRRRSSARRLWPWAAIAALVLWTHTAAAQGHATITGQVVDGATGVGLSDVPVQMYGERAPGTAPAPLASVLTDADGGFTLPDVPSGQHLLTISVVGYVLVRRPVEVGDGGSIHLVIPLVEGTGTYSERVEVKGDLFPEAEPGVPAQQVLGSADLQNLRGLVLDDPVRALQVLPGVTATDDLYSEFSVRGSDFGHIGLAVDGTPSRFLSHTVQGVEDGGSIGMINSDILQSVSLLNGSYPQRFGNRTGAQVEMTMRDGSRDRAQARLALSGSNAAIVGEGPLGRGRRASWLFSARKSYLDLLIEQVSDQDNLAFGFTDVAGKVVADLGSSHRVEWSGIAGRGSLMASQLEVGVNDPFIAVNRAWLSTVTWRATASPRATFTQRVAVTGGDFRNRSLGRVVLDEGQATDVSARSDAAWQAGRSLLIESGVAAHWLNEESTRRRVLVPGRPPDLREDASLRSRRLGGYVHGRWMGLGNGLLMAAGARVDHWDATGELTASPWAQAEWRAPGGVVLTAGTGLYRQFPAFDAIAGLHAAPDLVSERAWQTDVGLARGVGAHMRAHVVVYLREERDGVRLPGDEWQLADGRPRPPLPDTFYGNSLDGTARGVELLLQRRSPNGLSGWASYSVGRYRQHDRLTGERFDGDFDQRHAVNLYGVYRISDRTSVGLKFRASTNVPVRGYITTRALAAGEPGDDDPERYVLSDVRNTTRLPPYARLDLRGSRTFTFQRSRLTLFVELMNVLDRTNWRTGNPDIRPNGDLLGLLDPLVPFVPSAGVLVEF